VINNHLKLTEFVEAGCWLQLTAGSLVGRFGPQAQQTGFKIIDEGWNCLLATDAHNLSSRPPLLSEGRDAVAVRYGIELAQSMVFEKPAKILGLCLT
jgi:protein-tyrosine phosphatase